MKIIAGLGNPGPQYEMTRHNIGFLAVDRLIDQWQASGPVSKFGGHLYQAKWQGESLILIKPQTYMNLSGRCIGPLMHFYNCEPEDLVVIHDDLDLHPFALRIKTGGGTGGHNGLKSIDESLGKEGTKYHRIRIGIGHPSTNDQNSQSFQRSQRSMIPTADYVLQAFDDSELKLLDSVLTDVVDAAQEILLGHIQEAMNKYHRRKQE